MNKQDSKVIEQLDRFGLHKDEKNMRDKEHTPTTEQTTSSGFTKLVKKQK